MKTKINSVVSENQQLYDELKAGALAAIMDRGLDVQVGCVSAAAAAAPHTPGSKCGSLPMGHYVYHV